MTAPIDLPNQAPLLTALPHDQIARIRHMALTDLYFFSEMFFGAVDMYEPLHRPICRFLEDETPRFRLLSVSRAMFKTTIATQANTTRRALRDPNRTFLILNEVEDRAQSWLIEIRTIFEENKLLRAVFSDVIPKNGGDVAHWNSEGISLLRTRTSPQATISATGIMSSMTGDHYTDILIDDPVSEKAIDEPSTMEKAIRRVGKVDSFFSNPEKDRLDLIGTPWGKNDVIAAFRESFGDELAVFERPAVVDGALQFPTRLTWAVLERARRKMGDAQYGAQYLLRIRDPETADFKESDLQEYEVLRDRRGDCYVLRNLDRTIRRVIRPEDLDLTMTIDLAVAENRRSDRSAITVVGTTTDGLALVLDAWADRVAPGKLIEQVFTMYERWVVRVIAVAEEGYQQVFRKFVSEECDRRGVYLPMRGLPHDDRKKVLKIRSLQPIARTGRLFLGRAVGAMHMLRQELLDFPDKSVHDDLADSLGMHVPIMQGATSEARVEQDRMELKDIMRKIKGYGMTSDPDDALDQADDESQWDEFPEFVATSNPRHPRVA